MRGLRRHFFRRPPREKSLLCLPLLQHLVQDPNIRLSPRAIDCDWRYLGKVPISVVGFNPWSQTLYYGARSAFARWLASSGDDERRWNLDDHLVDEVLFMLHDYLHAWAYRAIHELRPDLEVGFGVLDEHRLETYAFCHLLTEAVAIVGLDYWFLCTADLNAICDIGTTKVHRGLAVSYHESFAGELRRCAPNIVVQDESFFGRIARLYCTGVLHGIDIDDLVRSAQLMQWLRHELGYGELQRAYIRMWLQQLRGKAVGNDPQTYAKPLPLRDRWQHELIAQLGHLLWEKIKLDKRASFTRSYPARDTWRPKRESSPDFRFTNLNAFLSQRVARLGIFDYTRTLAFDHFYAQFVSRYEYDAFDPALHASLPVIAAARDPNLLMAALAGQRKVPAEEMEPLSLLTLN